MTDPVSADKILSPGNEDAHAGNWLLILVREGGCPWPGRPSSRRGPQGHTGEHGDWALNDVEWCRGGCGGEWGECPEHASCLEGANETLWEESVEGRGEGEYGE